MPADWQWNLHRFSDGAYLGKMEQIQNRQLSPSFNAAGAASFQINLDDDIAYLIDNLSTYIVCKRDNVTKWEGKVWNTSEDAETNKMIVNCMGWWQEVQKRSTVEDISFANSSIGRIAWGLLAHTELHDGAMGFVVGPAQDAGFTLDNYKIGKDLDISAEIQKLTQVENGIDFYFDYTDRMFKFVNRYGTDKPDVEFGYKKGPHNLQNAIRNRDGTRVVNRYKAISPLSGNFVVTDNVASRNARGTYRETQTLTGLRIDSTLTPAQQQAQEAQALSAYGAAETILRGDPVTTYDVTLMSPGNNIEVPLPYVDFDLGDTVRLSVDRGRFSLNRQMIRVYGFTLEIGQNGEERLSSVSLSMS